ncbi:glycosyltransferase [Mucilaginibacter terrenus]|uniref:Glycosyltransferase n=1 Tax=Mucilaginibacter terrenus TaxID=2482727 RepID=A0A3E2NMP6_9SPHI|nr:glycosyltransferase family 2 protein [Mucilaginibacter terrenus]RFZ82223.1 glycosyltransferase [Mucilaginibacter terrenus]
MKNLILTVHQIKITVVTVCFNAEDTVERTIKSVLVQRYQNIEYIIIDGASTDDTMAIVNRYSEHISIVVSEPDGGIYDAMNKGIALATGDFIGMLNADDVFADENVLADIAHTFENTYTDAIYADLTYLKLNGEVFRKWKSGEYVQGLFNKGWMPPHPTFYCKRQLYSTYGNYDQRFGSAADYELMLRFVHLKQISITYIPRVFIYMLVGGISNATLLQRLKALVLDYKAMSRNNLRNRLLALVLKRTTKLRQFI